MQSLQNAIQTQYWAARDYLAPVLRDSKFKESGKITPEEFVAAGDFLVYKFPTWQWESGDKSKQRDFLPPTKQYLTQKNVPCIRRVSQMQDYSGDGTDDDREELLTFRASEILGEEDDAGDEWVATHAGSKHRDSRHNAAEIPDDHNTHIAHASTSALQENMAGLSIADPSTAGSSGSAVPQIDDIPDIEDDGLEGTGVTEPEDEAAATAATQGQSAGQTLSSNVLSVRTYDCSITYDKFYQTPRMWLSGFSPTRQPLTTAEIFEDVAADYAQKTVTIEPFPHREGISLASVHPCKHANVMKIVIERMNNAVREQQRKQKALESGMDVSPATGSLEGNLKSKKKGWGITSAVKKVAGVGGTSGSSVAQSAPEDDVEGLRVDQYLLVFLKFLSNVVPTIELDATTSL